MYVHCRNIIIYIYISRCKYACMPVCMYACMHVCMYACMQVCKYVCMYECMYMYVYVCICMYMYVYVCICMYMYVPTGWKPNQRFACFYVFHGINGVGWGGVITFICTSSHIWCNAAVRLFALPHIHDATPLYVVLHFLTYMMLRYCTSSCTSSHIWCNAAVRRLALPHMHDATLLYVVLHFLTYMMLP